MESKRQNTRREGPRRYAAPKEQCRSLPIMFLCFALLQYFMTVTSHRTIANAFVTTKTRTFRSSTKVPKTKLFFDENRNQCQEQFTNFTGIGNTKLSNELSATELSVSSSSSLSNICATTDTDGLVEGNDGENSNGLRTPTYKIYCDMDGCLVNFEKGVRTLLKTGSSDLDKRMMWEGISGAPLWFENLEWQMDGRRLWSAIKHLNPDILTGVPDIESSRVEKFNWCKRELGLEEMDAHHVDMAADGSICGHKSVNGNLPREDKTNIITCWSNNKYKECSRHGSILIDDRIDLRKNWEDAGGVFIHHVNTETTIRKLRDLDVISEGGLDNGENDWYWEGSWRLWTDVSHTETTIRNLRDLDGIAEGGLDNGENDCYWEGSWRMWTDE